MQFQFFIGKNDDKIVPRHSLDNTAAHYAWCFEKLLIGLENANSESSKVKVLDRFEENMKLSPGTEKMFTEVDTLFASLIRTIPLPDNNYIINCLKGLPVEDSRSYMRYESKG
jgi:hypothetical protein